MFSLWSPLAAKGPWPTAPGRPCWTPGLSFLGIQDRDPCLESDFSDLWLNPQQTHMCLSICSRFLWQHWHLGWFFPWFLFGVRSICRGWAYMSSWSLSKALWESWRMTGAKWACTQVGWDPEIEKCLNSSEHILAVDISQSKAGPQGWHFSRAQFLGNVLCTSTRKFTWKLKIWTISLIINLDLQKISKWCKKLRSRV